MNPIRRLIDRLFLAAPADLDRLSLRLTPTEASALALAARILAMHVEGQIAADVEQADLRMTSLLPEPARTRTALLSSLLQDFRPLRRTSLDDPRLLELQQAVQDRRVVHLHYFSHNQDEWTERDVEPYALAYRDEAWYLDGYCRLRQDVRSFRLDRIHALAPLPEKFSTRFMVERAGGPVEVRVRFDARVVRSVRERQHDAFRREEPLPGDRNLIMVYEVASFSDLRPWLLSWGAAAEVISPQDAREEMRQEALKLAARLN